MGPRDWLPPTSAYEVDYRRRGQRSLLIDDSCPKGPSATFLALLSLLFGVFALVCAVAPLVPSTTGLRWVFTTVGISAVFTGADAFRRRRGRASLIVTVLGSVGIGTGVLATVAMALTVLSTTWAPGIQTPQAFVQSVLPGAQSGASSAPLPPVPAPAATTASLTDMERSVGTLAFLMGRAHEAGTRWPVVLQVSAEGVVTARGLPGVVMRLPSGTALGYRTSTDGTAYALRLSSMSDASRYVDYDTNSNVVTAGSTTTGTGS